MKRFFWYVIRRRERRFVRAFDLEEGTITWTEVNDVVSAKKFQKRDMEQAKTDAQEVRLMMLACGHGTAKIVRDYPWRRNRADAENVDDECRKIILKGGKRVNVAK